MPATHLRSQWYIRIWYSSQNSALRKGEEHRCKRCRAGGRKRKLRLLRKPTCRALARNSTSVTTSTGELN